MLQPIRLRTLAGLALALTASVSTATVQAQTQTPEFVRTKVDAPLRNFQDRQGLALTTLEADTLLQVHGRSLGKYKFYDVSLAGGMPVWVYGQFLDETSAEGVLRVNGDYVNQRPRPSTSLDSMPLNKSLMTDDLVLMIKRQDTSKAWKDDWIQIWSPAHTRAWVEVTMTKPVADVSAAKVEWQAGLRSLPKSAVVKKASSGVKGKPQAASQKTKQAKAVPPVREEAMRSLRYSDSLFAQAISDKDTTLEQFQSVEDAYHRVLEMAPAGTTVRELAMQQLEKLKVHKNMAELRLEMKADETSKRLRIQELKEQQRIEDLKRTASWGRFHARGWVESDTIDGELKYFVRWDGGRQAELVCGSGRYDLAFYKGYQIGVSGSTRRPATEVTLEAPAQPKLIDVSRIEVIAGSAPLR